MSLASPFEPTHAMHCIIPWIDTRYRERESSLAELVQLISRTSDACVGNYLVFLPSYAYLERVYEAFVLARPERETWRQWPGQSHAARADVLTQLDQPGHRVGFAILGGVFGEGIDYVGDRLIGIVVVGTGLPGPGLERDLIIERYRSQGLNGYDFASRYPGYTRVLQTVGRLIRHEQDRGIVLLVDDRFELPFYRQLFPAHWNRKAPRDMNELTRMLDAFWSDASM